MSSLDPGLDRHEWETEWEELQEDLASSPAETLPEVDDLIRRMLEARGFDIEEPVTAEGVEPEVFVQYRAAHEVAARVDADDDVDPGDVADAVNGFTALNETLLVERSAP
jgi:hypothetical protein